MKGWGAIIWGASIWGAIIGGGAGMCMGMGCCICMGMGCGICMGMGCGRGTDSRISWNMKHMLSGNGSKQNVL